MKAVIQRAKSGKVIINNQLYSQINTGYVVFLGIYEKDSLADADKLIDKIINLRIMPDENDKMNLSLLDVQGEILVISQFTLCAEVSGRRPSFFQAKNPIEAEKIYNYFVEKLKTNKITVQTGKFAAKMQVEVINDGPVTIIMEN